MERLKNDLRYSQLRELTADLTDDGLRGMIRLLRMALYDRDGKEECPICTWDAEGNMKQLTAKRQMEETASKGSKGK